MSRRVFVVGVGMTKFEKPGRREGWDYPDMIREAGLKAFKDANVKYSDVQQVVVGYVYGESTSGQRAIYQLGLTGVPVYNVNNNCSTGSSALFLAKQLVQGGTADCVLAAGFEKMERGSLGTKWTDRTNPLDQHMEVITNAGREIESAPFAPQMFGNAGKEHMEKYGTRAETLAKIAEKNHRHSANNPYSQFQDVYTLDQVLKSPRIFGPLTKLQCCPTSDGAACAIVVSEDFVHSHHLEATAVEIVAMAMATDMPSTFKEKSCIKMVGFDMSKKAAQECYRAAGVGPQDVQVVELHDCLATDQEILTSSGWLGLAELERLEREQQLPLVASYDQERDALVYRPIDKLIIKPGGELIDLTHRNEASNWVTATGQRQDADGRSNNHVSLRVTRNHDMVVRLGRYAGEDVVQWSSEHDRKFHKVKAQTLLNSDPTAAVKLIGAAGAGAVCADDAVWPGVGDVADELPFVKLGLNREEQIDAFLELYGYWLGNGTLSENAIQFAPVKEREQQFLEGVLAVLPLQEVYRQPNLGARGERQYSIRDAAWFEVFDTEYGRTAAVVAPFGKSAKWFAAWVRPGRLSRAQLRVILRGLHHASNGASAAEKGVIVTSSIRFRDELQVMLLHAGYSAHFEAVGSSRGWRVRYAEKDDALVVLRPATDVQAVPTYTDRVWCVNTAPYHTILTRRVHKELVDGNVVVTKASRPVVVGNCFSANELITYEALGLAAEGKAGELVERGDVTYGGRWVVNPSGGLISKGHPLGATGIAQCAELCWQLRRMAGPRQVPNVKFALQHNIGLGGAAVVGIYRLGFPEAVRPLAPGAFNAAITAALPPGLNLSSTASVSASAVGGSTGGGGGGGGAANKPAAPKSEASAAAAAPKPQAKPPSSGGGGGAGSSSGGGGGAGAGSGLKSEAVFAVLEKRLAADPSLVQKIKGVYVFKISGGGGNVVQWVADLKNGNGSIRKVPAGENGTGDITISMADGDFVDLLTGKLNGQQAFMAGKLKMTGNMALAMKLNMLAKPQSAL